MVVTKILRWLRGYVIFTATGKFTARLINLAMVSNIAIINPIGEKGKLTAQVTIADYKELCRLRKKAMVRLKVIKKVGLPFVMYKNKKRAGLGIGVILFCIINHIFSMFLWTIDINGVTTVSEYEIKKCLADNGIYVGALLNSIDVGKSERDFSLQLGKVGWMSVNIMGNTATVEISESYDIPQITDKSPCNLKAVKTGQIVKMDVRNGKNAVNLGDGVIKGQLLVSGIVEIADTGKFSFVHSDGDIYAGVISNSQINIPKRVNYNKITTVASRRLIGFADFYLPIDFIPINNVHSQKLTTESFVLNNVSTPIHLVTQHNYTAENQVINLTKKQAENSARTMFLLEDTFKRWNCDIQKKDITCTENKDSYVFNAEYYCIENIAETVPINIIN